MIVDFSSTWDLIVRGEVAALISLFSETRQQLIKYALQITRDRFLAEEAVQDVFVNLWNNREKIKLTRSLKSYLYQSVHNYSVNKLVHQSTRQNSLSVLFSDESWQYIEENFRVDDFLIEQLETQETKKIIKTLVDELPDQCREIFILSRYHELTNNEISQKLNIAPSTVKTQIYRALEKIRELLYKKN
jgi:RNA polymerase sigma-70 factor (ECF subfamily)